MDKSQARTAFLAPVQTFVAGVEPAILASWQRCRALGVDQHRSLPDTAASGVTQRRDAFPAATLEVIKQMRTALAAATAPAGCQALFVDAQACALLPDGAEPAPAASAAWIPTWADFSEAVCGTNAVALALRHSKVMSTEGADHYLDALQDMAFVAAPVFSMDGRALGALALAHRLPKPLFDRESIVTDAADRIGEALLDAAPAAHRLHVLWDCRPKGRARTIVLLNDRGDITGISPALRTLLALDGPVADTGFATLFGESFSTVTAEIARQGYACVRSARGLQVRLEAAETAEAAEAVDGSAESASVSSKAIAQLEAALEASSGYDLRALEIRAIIDALRRNGGNISAAARQLGISRTTIHRLLRSR